MRAGFAVSGLFALLYSALPPVAAPAPEAPAGSCAAVARWVAVAALQVQPSELADFAYRWTHFPRADDPGPPAQLPCWLTYLEAPGKALIAEHLAESAMYGGAISARGPRYCPSVEDKIVRFPEAARHFYRMLAGETEVHASDHPERVEPGGHQSALHVSYRRGARPYRGAPHRAGAA